jgi:acyl transferase domain-containing protein/phosphopantetheinyl transferase
MVTGVLQQPTAIVGMAAILPGAGDLATYWQNLVTGRDAITEVPPERWGGPYYDPELAHRPDRLYCRRGGVVDEFATFQPLRYGIMPKSVGDIEPDQLLTLDVAAAAIEDAGGAARMPSGDRVGVIIGRGGTLSPGQARHAQRVRLPTQVLQILRELIPSLTDDQIEAVRRRFDEQLGPFQPEGTIGLVPNLAASRVANRLNLRGPAYTVDAACASSLLAVDQGIAELATGRLDAVLAGGVHHVHDISFWSVFNQLGALSRLGRIRPFDAAADGLLIGEGTGVVVLKRLGDAVRDGDRVYAVVRGTGVSSDGRSASMFNPASSGQALAIRRAWQAAGLDPLAPDAVGLIEAHGTATPTGDAAELATLAEVFGPPAGAEPAVIGSVKSMIGHAMPAAGIAGLIKAALAVHHGVLPPTLHVDNPRAELAATRFATIGEARPWEGRGVRRAGVNAFGFGGINAHVILEQWAPPVTGRTRHDPDRVLRLAANDPAALVRLLERPAAEVRALAPTAGACRIAIADPTDQRLVAARRVVQRGEPWRGGRDIWFSPRPLLGAGGGKVMFVFPGVEAEFAPRTADVAARFGLPHREWSSADLGQHGTGLVEVGALLHEALRGIGVRPDGYAGHSLGEWTAARVSGLMAAAGVDEFLRAFDAQSVEVSGHAFAAAGAGVDEITPLLPGYPGVVLSHDNAPAQTVVNGPSDQIERLVEDLRARRVMCQVLPFRSAFHTPAFEPGLRAIGDALGRFEIGSGSAPVWSATLAAPFPDDAAEVGRVFVRHMIEPVRFRSAVAAMHDAGFRVFLQMGAGQLASLIGDNLAGRDHLALPVNVSRRSGLAQLRRVAAALWVEGADPDFRRLDDGHDENRPHPGPVAKDAAVVVAPSAPRGPAMRLDLGGPQISLGAGAENLLDLAATPPPATDPDEPLANGVHQSVLRVSVEAMPYLMDHVFYAQPPDWPEVEDRWPVVPATTVAQHMMDAAEGARPGHHATVIRDARFNRWLIAAPPQDVEITVRPAGPGEVNVVFGGFARSTVRLAPHYPAPPADVWQPDPATERPPTISAERMYAERLMFHGPQFQAVTAVTALGDMHVRGQVTTPAAPGALLDNALQLIGNWIISTQPNRTVALPVRLNQVSFYGPHPAPGTVLDVVARIRKVDHGQVVGDAQLVCDGRLWAQIDGVVDRRFDSHPTARLAERFPQRHGMSQPQPEGWTIAYDCWTDLVTRGMAARGVLGAAGAAEYDRKPPATRKQWLLGRIAVKDAVRFQQWQDGHGDVYPIELTVVNEPSGRPRVQLRPGRGLRECDVSLAHCAEAAVALARPREAGAEPGRVGIDITEVKTFEESTIRYALSAAEIDLLPDDDRSLWFARFWAAKEAAAKAEGTGLQGRPRDFTVLAPTAAGCLVAVSGRTYPVGWREVGNPPELTARTYTVAWTLEK